MQRCPQQRELVNRRREHGAGHAAPTFTRACSSHRHAAAAVQTYASYAKSSTCHSLQAPSALFAPQPNFADSFEVASEPGSTPAQTSELTHARHLHDRMYIRQIQACLLVMHASTVVPSIAHRSSCAEQQAVRKATTHMTPAALSATACVSTCCTRAATAARLKGFDTTPTQPARVYVSAGVWSAASSHMTRTGMTPLPTRASRRATGPHLVSHKTM